MNHVTPLCKVLPLEIYSVLQLRIGAKYYIYREGELNRRIIADDDDDQIMVLTTKTVWQVENLLGYATGPPVSALPKLGGQSQFSSADRANVFGSFFFKKRTKRVWCLVYQNVVRKTSVRESNSGFKILTILLAWEFLILMGAYRKPKNSTRQNVGNKRSSSDRYKTNIDRNSSSQAFNS